MYDFRGNSFSLMMSNTKKNEKNDTNDKILISFQKYFLPNPPPFPPVSTLLRKIQWGRKNFDGNLGGIQISKKINKGLMKKKSEKIPGNFRGLCFF